MVRDVSGEAVKHVRSPELLAQTDRRLVTTEIRLCPELSGYYKTIRTVTGCLPEIGGMASRIITLLNKIGSDPSLGFRPIYSNTDHSNSYRLVRVDPEEQYWYSVMEITACFVHDDLNGKGAKYKNTRYCIRLHVVPFADNLEDDLKRRDFTINAMALNNKGHIVDPYNGQKDIKDKTLRTVGNPDDRFKEDALRMLRAIR